MPLNEIYSQPVYHRFKAPLFSKASFFILGTLGLTVICPLLVAYRSEGLWLKRNFYHEQPLVHFKHRFLFLLRVQGREEFIVWSSFPVLNHLEESNLRVPVLEAVEEDFNRDGKPDQIHISAEFPKRPTEDIVGASIIFLFDYKLELHSRLQMESLLFFDHHSLTPGSRLHLKGDLKLHQKIPLWHRGRDKRFNYPAINGSEPRARNFRLENILGQYSARNITTRFETEMEIWTPAATSTGSKFLLSAQVTVPTDRIEYETGFWELLKWAWIQYLSIMAIFAFVMSRVRDFVFNNRLLPVID